MNILLPNSDQLKKILKQTEIKFGRGSSVNWRNRDFEDLSFEINKQAKILISPATLKRLFGKVKTSSRYNPQENTIEALKIYSGYIEKLTETRKRKFKYFYLLALIPILVWFFIQILPIKEDPIGECALTLLKVEGQGPASAHFTYSVPERKDSLFLNFGDGSDLLYISSENQSISHFYGYPGYFNTNIRTREKVMSDTVKVFVPTSGWKALAYYFNPDLNERHFPVPFEGNVNDNTFHATRNNLSSLGIDPTKIIITQLDNYKETNSSGDNFTLNSRFKNGSFWPAIRCFSVHFTIQGTKGMIQVKFVGEGCSTHSQYILGEKSSYGDRTDLSCFAVDLHQWNNISIHNKNKFVSVAIADSVVFKNSYQQSIGKILGTSIMFHGSGSVDFINVQDSLNTTLFFEDFSE